MKKYTFLLLTIVSFLSFKAIEQPLDFKTFIKDLYQFDYRSDVKCYSLREKYNSFNYSKGKYSVPDNLECSGFYQAYSGRIATIMRDKLRSDSVISFDSIFFADMNNYNAAAKKLIQYYMLDSTFTWIFNETNKIISQGGSYESDKAIISIDSLMHISLSFFDITHIPSLSGVGFHFVCGHAPYNFTYENRYNFLISGFCKEAMQSNLMFEAFENITDSVRNLIDTEVSEIVNFQKVKEKYEPIFYNMLLDEGSLKESLITYYERRKNTELFELEY